jgi:hypothetical protein
MTFGDRSVSGIATGVSDLFAAQGERKAQGEPFEQQSYLDAVLLTSAGCADQGRHRRASLITEAGYQEKA